MTVWTRRGVVVVLGWAVINAVLAAVLVFFEHRTPVQQLALYWSSVGLLVTMAAVFLLPRRSRRKRVAPAASSGATSLALAGACLFGALAWVWGLYLVYFAAPLLAFCLARWRVEWRQRREQP